MEVRLGGTCDRGCVLGMLIEDGDVLVDVRNLQKIQRDDVVTDFDIKLQQMPAAGAGEARVPKLSRQLSASAGSACPRSFFSKQTSLCSFGAMAVVAQWPPRHNINTHDVAHPNVLRPTRWPAAAHRRKQRAANL